MTGTHEQLAKLTDHSLPHPTMTDWDMEDGCRIASICIKPCYVRRAVELLRGSGGH